MKLDRLFQIIWLLGIVAETAIRLPYNRERQRNQIVDDRVSVQERALLGVMFMGMFLLPLVRIFSRPLNWADYRLSRRAKGVLGGLGALFEAAALWLFWRAHIDLGRNWSPSLQIRAEHTLVTDGVYRYIRHPMYASQWLFGIAQALLLHNWLAGLANLVCFVPLYVLRVPREEQMMLDQFGDDYRRYMARTGAVLPRLRRD